MPNPMSGTGPVPAIDCHSHYDMPYIPGHFPVCRIGWSRN